MLIIHIIIALAGLLLSGASAVRPSSNLIKFSSFAVASTLVTGIALVFQIHSSLTSACLSGIAYLALTTAMIVSAARRLSAVRVKA